VTQAHPLWVKICGLRTAAAVAAAVEAGADALGFVFHEPSPRNLTPAEAKALAVAVPPGTERVAVFLHPAQSLVDAVLEAVQPDTIQADAADLARLRLPPGLRTLPVLRSGSVPPQLPPRFLYEGMLSGAGETADWAEAAALARRGELLLAGGLAPSNVASAIACVRPSGVDVSSGVESSRGVKDAAMIHDFVSAARAAHARSAG
jgi:phosphoribosylanthranilate isomerase